MVAIDKPQGVLAEVTIIEREMREAHKVCAIIETMAAVCGKQKIVSAQKDCDYGNWFFGYMLGGQGKRAIVLGHDLYWAYIKHRKDEHGEEIWPERMKPEESNLPQGQQ